MELLAHYAELEKSFPRSMACKRIPLDFISGQRFRCRFDAYVRSWLRKGIPSLFNDVRSLYSSPEKVIAFLFTMCADFSCRFKSSMIFSNHI